MQLLSADMYECNIVQCGGHSTRWGQLAALLHHAYSHLQTYQKGLTFHNHYCVSIHGTNWVKYN